MGHYRPNWATAPILHGDEAGSVAMYPDLIHLWRGMTRRIGRDRCAGQVPSHFNRTVHHRSRQSFVVLAMTATGRARWRWFFYRGRWFSAVSGMGQAFWIGYAGLLCTDWRGSRASCSVLGFAQRLLAAALNGKIGASSNAYVADLSR